MSFFDDVSDYFYKNKNDLGILFFAISVLLLGYLFIHPMNQYFIHGDERFTLSLVNLSLNNAIDLIIKDVHPPLYYLILMGFNHLVGNTDIVHNLFISKIVSIIPYILLLIISAIKIRKDEGWFTAGLFTFTIITMSGFFTSYCTLRMYSWSLLFSILSYLYFKEIFKDNSLKNWVLFTVFCILGAYTHYFTLFPSFIMYCLLLFNIYFKNKNDKIELKEGIKKWFMSVLLAVVLYIPWLTVLLQQVSHAQGDYSWSIGYMPTLGNVTNYVTFCAVNDNNFTIDAIILKLLTILLIIILLGLLYKTFNEKGCLTALNSYDGIIIYLLTIIIGTIVLNLTFQPLIERYVIPAMGIFWLSFALILNKLKNKRIFFILLVICLLLSCGSFVKMEMQSDATVKNSIHREELMDKLNNNDTVIIWPSNYRYSCYHNYLNNTIQYSRSQNKWTYVQDYKVEKNISKIVEDNPDKKVYIMDEYYKNPNKRVKYPKDIKTTPKKGYDEFILLTKK